PSVRRGTATLRGVVTGADGKPRAGAQIVLADQGRDTRSGGDGAFVLDSLAAGTFVVEARSVGRAPARRAVDLRGRGVTTLSLALAERAATLDRVLVAGERRRAPTLLDEFAARRLRGAGGHFVGPAELERMVVTRTTDVLRTVPGVVLRTGFGALGSWRQEIRMRGGCAPRVLVDGFFADTSAYRQLDQLVPMSAVAAIEVYPSGLVPAQWGGTDVQGCGVVMLWTRRGGT
ncbi:carboxypeptidase regulatory-like domain-containing protein, partial [Roseisolibacter sp. H3M3-2]|uniref:TonB-dependent receptor n=1 Tax=Roseisolibacter sp. H3M3-2 TaxID=3031323 RepID=UPI0023DB714A